MGLFDTIKNVIRGKVQEAEEALADPVRDGKLAIEDAQKALVEYKRDIAGVMTERATLERELKAAKEESKKYSSIAEKAIEADNDNDALQALEIKSRNEARTTELQGQLKIITAQIGKLRAQMEKRRTQIADASRNITQLKARQNCAKVRKAIAEASDRFGGSSDPFSKLDKLEGQVQKEEDEAMALEDLNDSDTGEEALEEKYESATSDAAGDLAALKAKMGK